MSKGSFPSPLPQAAETFQGDSGALFTVPTLSICKMRPSQCYLGAWVFQYFPLCMCAVNS